MRWRSMLACTVLVLIAHGALIEALTRHALAQAVDPGSGSRGADRLSILDRDAIARLMAPAAPMPAALPVQAPAKASSTPAAVPADPDDAQASGVRSSARSAPAVRGPGMAIYRPPAELDVAVRTRSAPDLSMLDGLTWSGLPIRLRLFIDTQGSVLDAQVLASAEAPEVVERVRKMFLATGFTQGTIRGEPVASYKDIEITVGSPPDLPPRARQ